MRAWTIVGLLAAAWIAWAAPAAAHEVRPAYFEITETAPQHFTVLWKQPAVGELALRLKPRLSNGWLETTTPEVAAEPAHLVERWTIDARGRPALDGATIAVDGLENSITDVLVRASLADGRRFETILRPAAPSASVRFAATGGLPTPAYFRLGVQHILTGVDHLSFVFGLILLTGLRPALLKAITAFTVAHSLTLAASALGLLQAPPAVVEALVALSILALAVELVRGRLGAQGLTHRRPWLVAFAFGLLHGCAFAGALRETGLPPGAVPQALFLFNLGVEAGQLLFVAAVGLLAAAARALAGPVRRLPFGFSRALPEYALGAFAAYWLIERTSLIFA